MLLNKDRLHFNIKLNMDAAQIVSSEGLYVEQIGTINNYQVLCKYLNMCSW